MTQPREILEAALKLDPTNRAAIASEILESLEDSAYGQLSPAWRRRSSVDCAKSKPAALN
jgi:hypothetical protein